MIAGVPCTAYSAIVNNRTGEVCLADDGVLLYGRIDDPAQRRELRAVRVTYSAQPAAYFMPPPGFVKVNASSAPLGTNPGSHGPGARGGGHRRHHFGGQTGR